MTITLTPDELHIILKALEKLADDQNDFTASVAGNFLDNPAGIADARRTAQRTMDLFDALARQGGYK